MVFFSKKCILGKKFLNVNVYIVFKYKFESFIINIVGNLVIFRFYLYRNVSEVGFV